MVVQAYILIQTEVGKAAAVARQIAELKGVTQAEDVTGPYDVIVRAEAKNVDELGKLVVAKVQSVDGHHPDADLPGRPPLSRRRTRPRRSPTLAALRSRGSPAPCAPAVPPVARSPPVPAARAAAAVSPAAGRRSLRRSTDAARRDAGLPGVTAAWGSPRSSCAAASRPAGCS